MHARRGQHDGVAVGRRLRDLASGQRARGAGLVLDDDGLPQVAGHLRGQQPGEDVRGAAGGDADHHLDGLAREVVGVGGAAQRESAAGEKKCALQESHGKFASGGGRWADLRGG
ncbi:hypothetical protein D3C79_917290 [compost metagenome]